MEISNSVEFMESLNWNANDLVKEKEFLIEWDKRDQDYYKNISKLSAKVDKCEREHYRNCIKYWEKKNEIKSIRNT